MNLSPETLSLLDAAYAPQAWFLSLSPYISLSIVGVIIAALLACSGFVLARLGYKPLWALLLIVPTVGVIAMWVLAYRKFPREKISS
jgi:hypothetical protein